MTTDLLPSALTQISWAILLVAFLVAFVESAVGLGVVMPGEAFVAAVGALAASTTDLLAVGGAVVAGAMTADQLGYLVGRRWGPRIQSSRIGSALAPARWRRLESAMDHHGFGTVAVSRWLPTVRTLVPVLAGITRLNLAAFTVGSLVGGTVWAAWWLGAGAVLASAPLTWSTAAVVTSLTLGAGLILAQRRRSCRTRVG